jgi:hypothetical protein
VSHGNKDNPHTAEAVAFPRPHACIHMVGERFRVWKRLNERVHYRILQGGGPSEYASRFKMTIIEASVLWQGHCWMNRFFEQTWPGTLVPDPLRRMQGKRRSLSAHSPAWFYVVAMYQFCKTEIMTVPLRSSSRECSTKVWCSFLREMRSLWSWVAYQ